jgi:hypothetical protein
LLSGTGADWSLSLFSNLRPALTNIFFRVVALACGENARAAEIADCLARFTVLNNRETPDVVAQKLGDRIV